jgi:2'-5' RNA ligase
MIRLFAAIAIPGEIAAPLMAATGFGVHGARWSPLENLHITLRFAGDIAESLAEDLDSALGSVTSPPFQLTIAGVGSFGDASGLAAIWAGVSPSEPLSVLHGRCEAAARRAGLKPDPRAWKPHVTVAYLKGADPAEVARWTQANSLLRSPPFTVDRFGLYSSWRTRSGSAYRLERSYSLRQWPRGPSARQGA